MTIPLVLLLGFLAFGLVRWGKQKPSEANSVARATRQVDAERPAAQRGHEDTRSGTAR